MASLIIVSQGKTSMCFLFIMFTMINKIHHDNIFSAVYIYNTGETSMFLFIIFFRMINNKTFSLNRCFDATRTVGKCLKHLKYRDVHEQSGTTHELSLKSLRG